MQRQDIETIIPDRDGAQELEVLQARTGAAENKKLAVCKVGGFKTA